MALSKLAPTPRAPKGPSCEVCKALAKIPPAEADALRSHLANPEWRYSELSIALANDPDTPLDLPAFTLARHARGQCGARERLRGA